MGRQLVSEWWSAPDTAHEMAEFKWLWPYEQGVMDKHMLLRHPSEITIAQNAMDFNTPEGRHVVHNWWKDNLENHRLRELLTTEGVTNTSQDRSVSVIQGWFDCNGTNSSIIQPFENESLAGMQLFLSCI
eukprot:TRINITY_DN107208_c0_g1_i1.p1 TRINITY_DN107208_c0_g1~~TRINITY_DN107208_c0_g1_i1.p1  ORF type:complete len:130 (+),score=10.71 TRINITY_DN107208_c0_g1_i1:382-771(+)